MIYSIEYIREYLSSFSLPFIIFSAEIFALFVMHA